MKEESDMKQAIKYTLSILTLLAVSLGTMAEVVIKEASNGTVTQSTSGTTVTLTVEPSTGYYISELKVVKTIDGGQAQTRVPNLNPTVTVTPTDANADLGGTTTWTFATEANYGYEVTATFEARTDLVGAKADINLPADVTYTYNGQAQKPATVTVTLPGGDTPLTLTEGTDYTLTYTEDCTNAGTKTITATGKSKYSGTVTKDYEILKAPVTFTFKKGNDMITANSEPIQVNYGATGFEPTLVVEPAIFTDVEYTFSSDNGDIIEINASTGKITTKGVGMAFIAASPKETTYDNFETESTGADYTIVIAPSLTFPESAYSTKYGEAFTAPKATIAPANTDLTVTYASSNTDVATIDASSGAVTINKAGEATITATLPASEEFLYSTVTASYTLTINKGTIALSYSATTAEGKMGEAFTAPTLNNPSQVAVTYSSSNTEVATIGTDGAVTLKGPGKTTITATFAGNDNYEGASASYELTVGKQQEAGLSWTDEGMEYYIGDYWYGPRLNNPNKLKVKYESSDEDVATIDENGVVTVLGIGDTWIMAVFEGNDEYEPQTVRYGLFVKERYNLWVGGQQVTSENCSDILGNGQFFYNEDEKTLVVTNSTKAVDIENRKGDLTIFLNGNSKLGRIFFNKGETDNSGSLTITTYENIPGATTLETSDANGVISGFSSLNINSKTDLFLIDPEDGTYSGGSLKTAEDMIAKNATIGQYIKPLVKGSTIDFPIEKFENKKLTNTVIDDVHYALVQHDEDTDEDDDYYDPEIRAIVLNNLGRAPYDPLYNPLAEDLLGDLIPGSRKYASEAKSLMTFMVPDGKGKISLDVETDRDHHLNLTIGNGEPKRISKNKREKVEFDYDVDKPTYCFLYLGEGGTGASGTRIGKRDKAHGTIYSVKVKAIRTTSTNPLGGISGFPDASTPEVDTFGGDDPTGISEIKVETDNTLESNDDNWYDLQGRRIDKPTKAGIYIWNRKKIVIK